MSQTTWRTGLRICAVAISLLAPAPSGSGAPAASDPGIQADVRRPAVAGDFYPADAATLRAAVQTYLSTARPSLGLKPVAIVVPHAGYVFSGQIAADAFAQTAGQTYDTVVILGTNHTSPDLDRIAAYRGAGFRTPLGLAEIDQTALAALIKGDPDVVWNARAHEREHSVEVHVPFVQQLFPSAKIVPLVVGAPDPVMCARLGRSLATALQGSRALVVASSDLSHYPAAADARRVDRETLDAIASLDATRVQTILARHAQRGVPGLVTGACGQGPILAAMAFARAAGVSRGTVVSYANSGDSPAGDAARAVGYGAVVMAPGEPPPAAADGNLFDGAPQPDASSPLTRADRRVLLDYARDTIRQFVTTGTAPLSRAVEPRLLREVGAFVTLKKRGELRGCIGRISPNGPVHWLVGAMALQAAVNDPRFDPVRPNELPQLEVEVSLLTPPREIPAAAAIVVGRDGVILMKDGQSAVFLPEVALEQGWTRDTMLDNLCLKAGLSPGCWRSGARLATFQSQVIKESDVR